MSAIGGKLETLWRYRLSPSLTSGGTAAIFLPTVAKRCIPDIVGQDARFRASTGLASDAVKADLFYQIDPKQMSTCVRFAVAA